MNDIQLKALNEMINWCIMNGGDAGGPYDSCPGECEQAIAKFLISMGEEHLRIIEDKDNWRRPTVVRAKEKQLSEIWQINF